jgi:DNA-binding transcriptional MerR regulator
MAVTASRDGGKLTIEQLARETGMTVRNIRAHQARGLLPPPEVRRRTGYYNEEHVARLRLIQELQTDGFNLRGIKRLLEETRAPAGPLLGLKQAASRPFETEAAEIVTRDELARRFGEDPDGKLVDKAVRLGLLEPLGDDRFEAPSPALLGAAERVVARGVPVHVVLAVFSQLEEQMTAASRSFVRLFMERVWKPFDAAGRPPEEFPEVLESIEELRPIASEAVLSVFKRAMSREVEAAVGKELARLSKRKG